MKLLIHSPKKENQKLKIRTLDPVAVYYLSLKVFGGTMQAVVKEGDRVLKYQLIARFEGTFSTCLHAPVSGIVERIELSSEAFLVIRNDFKEEELVLPAYDPDQLTPDELLQRIEEAGIVGCGGAQFPTHLKSGLAKEKKIDHFIVNGTECEPYLTADYAVMNEYTSQLLKGISYVQRIVNAGEIVITLERQNRALKAKFERSFADFDLPVRVQLVPDVYPQGGELQLIKSVTGMELRKGSRTVEHGVAVSNVGTLWAVYRAVCERKNFIERIVSVNSPRNVIGGNFLLRLGTPIRDVIKQIVPENTPVEASMLFVKGGPMMGQALRYLDEGIGKGTGGILILPPVKTQTNNCIGCGYCVDVCPQKLMPLEFVRPAAKEDKVGLEHYHVMDCIECAACAYICPSDVPLLESIYRGKQLLRTL